MDEAARAWVADQMLNNVVIVVSRAMPTSPPQYGLGFIFGRQNDILWIATAAHVVMSEPIAGQFPVPDTTVEVKLRSGTTYSVLTPAEMTTAKDVAFLAIQAPVGATGPDMWREPVVIEDPQIGESVSIAGAQHQIKYGPTGATIKAIQAGNVMEFNQLNGGFGQSGAPVVTDRGFLGMYVQSDGQRVIPIQAIRKAATDANRPWMLTAATPAPVSVLICLDVIGEVLRPPSLNGPGGLINPASNGCLHTQSGPHFIIPADKNTVCQPFQVEIGTASPQSLRVECLSSPTGTWHSPTYGALDILPMSDNVWSVEGLDASPYGKLKGTLRGQPPILTMELMTEQSASFFGSVKMETRRISGRLLSGSTVLDLEVKK